MKTRAVHSKSNGAAAGEMHSNSSGSMDTVGKEILRHFGASRVAIAEIDLENGTETILDTWHIDGTAPYDEFPLSTLFGDSMVKELSRGKTVAIADVSNDPNTAGVADRYLDLGIRSSLHAPYPIDARFLFKLSIHKPEPYDWSADEVDLCRELAASVYLRLERSRAIEKLLHSESRLRLATEAAEMFVWEADVVTKKISWAENAEKVLGCRREELADDFAGAVFFVHPEERERVVREVFKAVAAREGSFTVDYRGLDDGVTPLYWRTRAFVIFDHDGKPVRLVGTTQNISSQKQSEMLLQESEERLRLILESVVDHAIMTTDSAGFVTEWNPGAEVIFGYSREEIVGQSCAVLFTPEDRENNVPAIEIETALIKGRAMDERWHLRKDGTRFYASGVLSPIKGLPGGFVKIARDLTAKQRAEEALKQAREELELRVVERTRELDESNAALRREIVERHKAEEQRVGLLRKLVTTQEDERGRIARDLHDQLGQHLTALRLKIASLKDECRDNKELCDRVESLEQLGAKLDADVNFLAWELRPRALDDLGLVTAVENYTHEWSQHFGIPADFHSSGLMEQRLEPEIETNLYRIAQEALNNVFKHAKATSTSVILERRDGEAVLIVEDNGSGFDLTNIRSDRASGRGLGLIGMRERAAIVGGAMEIETAKDAGSTIFVKVPATFVDQGA